MKNDKYCINSFKNEEKSLKIEFFGVWGYLGGDDVIRSPSKFSKIIFKQLIHRKNQENEMTYTPCV